MHQLYNGQTTLKFTDSGHRYAVSHDGGLTWTKVEGVTGIISNVVAKDGLIQWAANMACEAFSIALEPFLDQKRILRPAELKDLSERARKAHTARKEKGADVGKTVHYLIEHYIQFRLNGEFPDDVVITDRDVLKAFTAFTNWDDKHRPKYIFSEKPLYSLDYNYAGTCDVCFELDGTRYIADFKTSEPKKEYKNGKYTGKFLAYPEHFLQCAAYDLAHHEESGKSADAYMILYVTKSGKIHTFESHTVEDNKEAWLAAIHLHRWLRSQSTLHA